MLRDDGRDRAAKQTIGMVPESQAQRTPSVKAVPGSIDLAEQAQAVGPVTELEQKVAQTRSIISAIRSGDRAQCPGQPH